MSDPRPHVLMFWFMDDWGRYGRTYEQIARELASRDEIARVVCVFPKTWIPPTDIRLPLSIHQWSRKLVALTPQPHVLPSGFRPWRLRKWANDHLPARSLLSLLNVFGYRQDNTMLWLFPPHPYIEELRELIPHRYQLMHVIDNNSLLVMGEKEVKSFAQQQYRSLANHSNRIYVNSVLNEKIFGALHPRVSLFENAVAPSFFGKPRLCRSNPVLAYLGWVTERTDVAILEHLADYRQDWRIHLAAPDNEEAHRYLNKLLRRPNVSWFRDLPQWQAPEFLSEADICLMPHQDTRYSRSMSPLKFYQFLASGRPVVSTPVAGIERWVKHIYMASGPKEFAAAVEKALLEDTQAAAQARIEAMRNETWAIRVDAMLIPLMRDWYGSITDPVSRTMHNCIDGSPERRLS
jgi:glycosyltransferase involved in cell wall biosynthesis